MHHAAASLANLLLRLFKRKKKTPPASIVDHSKKLPPFKKSFAAYADGVRDGKAHAATSMPSITAISSFGGHVMPPYDGNEPPLSGLKD